MDGQITCRVCSTKTAPQDDGILLCPICRNDPSETRTLVDDALKRADDRFEATMCRCSIDTLRRWGVMLKAYFQALDHPEQMVGYLRRRKRTIDQKDELSQLLSVEDALFRAKTWAMYAELELDALSDVLSTEGN